MKILKIKESNLDKQDIVHHAIEGTVGAKMTYAGSATAVISGIALNNVEVQLIGVMIGAVVGIIGLLIQGTSKYAEHKLNVQKALQNGEWDGKKRRGNT